MIPLKDNWRLPFSFIELWRNLNRMARWLNGMQLEGGEVIHNENGIRLSPGSSGGSRVIAWGCTNVGLVITVKVGKVYFKGVAKTVGSTPGGWPNVTITATTFGYLSMSLTDGAVAWGTSATDPGDGDDDTEIFRIFAATVSSGVITELLECQHGDIRSMGNA